MKKITHLALAFIMILAVSNQTSAQCIVPTGLSVTVVSPTSTALNWPVVAGALSYRLEIQNATGNNVPFLATANVTTNTYTINGLTAGANYKYKVRTVCSSGKSNWSTYFLFTSGTGQTQCGIPTGLAASAITSATATLSWNTSVGPLVRYNIEVENATGNNVPFSLVLTSTTNSISITGLTASKNYKFKVRKICGTIKSPWTSWSTFTTTAFTGATDSRITSSMGNGNVTVYPNPAVESINVKLEKNEGEVIEMIQLMDINGRFIQSRNVSADEQDEVIGLDTQSVQGGVYVVVVKTNQRSVPSRVLVVK